MQEKKQHLQKETKEWHKIQHRELNKLRSAQHHLLFNVGAYLAISIIEFYLAEIGHSQTLRADALNNLAGIISAVLLLVGIFIARDIDDDDLMGQPLPEDIQNNGQRLQLTRFHYETVFTLITGIVMIAISLNVIYGGFKSLMHPKLQEVPQPITLLGAGVAMVIMIVVWWMNRSAGLKLQNAALTAASQDSLSDALTSLGTMVAIGGALLFKISWLDGVASIIVGIFILVAGIKIFKESSLNLADYFDPKAEMQFRKVIENNPQIKKVEDINAHYSGNMVTMDVIIAVDAHMEVKDSYRLGEEIEAQMRRQFGIVDTDVMVVPA
ncbi:cation diffusion facilitator family transporter [Companilactobacillus bobalius]|uniref:Co Zn Cd cation transporter n=2 Tax=Companilactobacillus bobalius TaxID=2801451 RepID=A0A0R1KT17_9LACO|nr:cation diffusion facilitator family transporter [Companilactobacillus bobalius]KAE9558423.1 cobalt-zinc-cadmium resistance protein [Companilactobacillus bobalius]KRK83697.1 Co Zn Cd cation transporter [Companilactobacillus bobalius DSM 19674]OVE96208.1 putative transporter YeaB [Companilactobacillus bobalius]GEO58111.1 cobalt-zinc-cadmium resistance protein [Companilactobacillus paralimentarius]